MWWQQKKEGTMIATGRSLSRGSCSDSSKKTSENWAPRADHFSHLYLIINNIMLVSASGGVAHMVERSLRMREARGSIPRTSIFAFQKLSSSL
jgi:hypothetical protein